MVKLFPTKSTNTWGIDGVKYTRWGPHSLAESLRISLITGLPVSKFIFLQHWVSLFFFFFFLRGIFVWYFFSHFFGLLRYKLFWCRTKNRGFSGLTFGEEPGLLQPGKNVRLTRILGRRTRTESEKNRNEMCGSEAAASRTVHCETLFRFNAK